MTQSDTWSKWERGAIAGRKWKWFSVEKVSRIEGRCWREPRAQELKISGIGAVVPVGHLRVRYKFCFQGPKSKSDRVRLPSTSNWLSHVNLNQNHLEGPNAQREGPSSFHANQLLMRVSHNTISRSYLLQRRTLARVLHSKLYFLITFLQASIIYIYINT